MDPTWKLTIAKKLRAKSRVDILVHGRILLLKALDQFVPADNSLESVLGLPWSMSFVARSLNAISAPAESPACRSAMPWSSTLSDL